MVQAEVFFFNSARRSALEPSFRFRLKWKVGFEVGTGEAVVAEGGDGRWGEEDGGGVTGGVFFAAEVLEDGEKELGEGVEAAGRRRVRPAGSQTSFFPERRRSWT